MRSRANVGRILLDSEVDAIVFNAGIIIGSGSASFEMIRHLATTLRWMPAPDWVSNRVEPLSVRDALYYLLSAADVQEAVNRSFDIGSRQILTYANVMRTFAAVAGLKPRHVIALPLPAPTLSGIWVGLVTRCRSASPCRSCNPCRRMLWPRIRTSMRSFRRPSPGSSGSQTPSDSPCAVKSKVPWIRTGTPTPESSTRRPSRRPAIRSGPAGASTPMNGRRRSAVSAPPRCGL